ncbi:hypothetical protein TcBrA4_0120860 [Trypanosoma cruzi]|nr:hypothetical protein TcBrA4_0120860 [Trypanosoma cruzi]
MAATAPAARHPKHMPLVQLGCRTAGHAMNLARKRLLLPLDSTPPRVRRPADCRCAASTAVAARDVVMHGSNAVALRAPRRCGSQFLLVCRSRREFHRNHRPHLSEDEGEGRHTDRTPRTQCRAQAEPFAARRCTTNEPGSECVLRHFTCSTAPGARRGVPVNMTIRLHPPRSGARPVDSLPSESWNNIPFTRTRTLRNRAGAGTRDHALHDVLTATGGRAMPGPGQPTPRHNLRRRECHDAKIDHNARAPPRLKHSGKNANAAPATLPPRETPSSAQEAMPAGGRRTVRPK